MANGKIPDFLSKSYVFTPLGPWYFQIFSGIVQFHLNYLGEGNLIFCCMGPTDSNFWQIKVMIIILISHVDIFPFTTQFSPNMIFFFRVAIKLIKNKNLVCLTSSNHSIKIFGCFFKHKFLYFDDQYFYFSICQPLN